MAQTALITGASSGIGEALAEVFARHGYDLVLVARSEDKLVALAERLKATHSVEVVVDVCDLTQTDAAKCLIERLKEKAIHIDCLVNNAGFGDFGLFIDSDLDKQQRMIALNIAALTELTHLLLPAMRIKGQGKILNLASTASFQPGPYMSVYYASKAYVLSFSEAIANELSGSGITVTALCLGPTASGFQQVAGMNKSGLAKAFPIPSSEAVAEYGYRAMMSGRRVAVSGWLNRLLVQLPRLVPRRLLTAMVSKINRPG